MPFTLLEDRALILVSGPEAEHFLQNILTVDLETLKPGEAKPGALLTPQGKILFDFLISRAGADTFRIECRADIAGDFQRRLMLYKLRAKAEITQQDQPLVAVRWQDDSSASHPDSASVIDTRFPGRSVTRSYGPVAGQGDLAGWHRLRIANGIAESGLDYQLGDAFPHDVLLDQTGGVGFRKGCYVGQEVVSRMQHRGTARRRVLIVSADEPLPAAGTDLTVNARSVGTLGSTSGGAGLAIARIDRVKAALDTGEIILADAVPVRLSIPEWATFTFPQDATDASENA
ncbi:aminomethyltransferase [Mesorhizobium sp. Root157]|uniref:CAF17-like 4Fe-4S cluster assembly/insertion protein YgfZ n=1 Tax=Mesorhizobium sp. Root157 TaxID=1736477 RepID=UPI0006F912B7|nr:folate-binding protein YgfZ [Mesorhizobium sp. Root157]KQZ94257.1 aminomethyltransferase [Mesorhizobium sp. Root157]